MEDLRKIVRDHIFRHNAFGAKDGMGRPYGWTDEEIDAMISDLLGSEES